MGFVNSVVGLLSRIRKGRNRGTLPEVKDPVGRAVLDEITQRMAPLPANTRRMKAKQKATRRRRNKEARRERARQRRDAA